MPLIKWSENISVGIALLDDEHKRMVEMLNDLYDALRKDESHEMMSDLLDSLVRYSLNHFKHEEDLFTETDYPEASEHKAHHDAALHKILQIQSDYNEHASLETCHELFEFLTHWFEEHLINADQKYTKHLNSYGVR